MTQPLIEAHIHMQPPALSFQPSSRTEKVRAVSTPSIDEAELNAMLVRAGLALTPDQVRAILPGAAIFRRMIARVNAPLPREAEPALTFDVEQS